MSKDIIQHIYRVNALRDLAGQLKLMPMIHQLQYWQCERLLISHDDLAKQQRYQKAMAFFVEELYGPKDFSQRDADLVRVIPKLAKVLPEKAMNAMNDALSLNALSFDLDMAMAQYLTQHYRYWLARSAYSHYCDQSSPCRLYLGDGKVPRCSVHTRYYL